MEISKIKEEVELYGDINVKQEKHLSSVVYKVHDTSEVNIKPKQEDPPQSRPIWVPKEEIQSAIEITVKVEENPTTEPESKKGTNGESETCKASLLRRKQIFSKKKKRAAKIEESPLLQCTLCPQSFSRVAFLITHARNEHATVKNLSLESVTHEEDKILSQCPLCSTSFASFNNLRNHFLRFHITNKPFQCSVCLESTNEIKKFATERFLKAHIKLVHDPARFKIQCDICSYKFACISKYKCHKLTHIKKRYKCEYCSKDYKRKEGLLKHIIAVHQEYTDRHETFKCDSCEQLFCSQKDLKFHVLQTHVEDTVQCKTCLKKFREEGELRKHLERSHKERRTWLVCDVCSKVCKNNQDLVQHLEMQHKRFFKCRKCFRSFVSKQEYDGHSVEFINKKGRNSQKSYLQCKICLVFLNSECAFTTHKETHLNPAEIERKIRLDLSDPQDRIMKCDFCPKTFIEKSLLLDHATKCHPNRKWKCKSCEKSFQVKFQLNKHELLHSTKKLFECQVCQKCFANLNLLKAHERIHKIDKKYQCSQCEKSFVISYNLRVHIAHHHGGAKPFKCAICKKGFALKALLVQHSRVHTDEKPFSCSKCSHSFKRGNALKRHERQIHSEDRLNKYKKSMSHLVLLGPHLKYFKNLVFVCILKECAFEAKDEKEVAIHYAKHKLPQVVLPRLLHGPSSQVFLSKSTQTNKHMIQVRYKCEQCLKVFSFTEGLRNHTRINHSRNKTKRKK